MFTHARRVVAPNPGEMTLGGTNTWVLRMPHGDAVVDPGPGALAHVLRAVDELDVRMVFLTHRHVDHAGALRAVPSHVPVFAGDPGIARRTKAMTGGEVVRWGPWRIQALALPGHTDDSLGFDAVHDSGERILFTGDTLLGGRSRTFISRHTGDLARLLESLELLTAYSGVMGAPGHGEMIADVGLAAVDAVRHRRERLDRLAKTLLEDPTLDLAGPLTAKYADSPARLAAARWMLRTDLEYLDSRGALPEAFFREALPPGARRKGSSEIRSV